METGIKVYDAMTMRPVVVEPKKNLVHCAKLMAARHIGSLIVKDGDRFAGIITEQDMVRRAIAHNLNPEKTEVEKVMTTDVVLAHPNMDIVQAMNIMRDYDVRHLPVVDNGRLLGLVTVKDILKIEPDLFDILVEKFEIAEASRKPINNPVGKDGVCKICGKYSPQLKMVEGVLTCPDCQ
ncbi:CBS domain-containing protein [Candidatus Woesearchaeota archaeon]|nr:CBS domain-containing protein [Candidatus Woesearchaeota archaeon]